MPPGQRVSSCALIALVGAVLLVPCRAVAERQRAPSQPLTVPELMESECSCDPPGFEVTWEADAETLFDHLLAWPVPTRVTITEVSITPDSEDIDEDETLGHYESFNLDDGTYSLSIPDGIVLTTGTFLNSNNYANCCNDVAEFSYESDDTGDEDIADMYYSPPDVADGAAITVKFTASAAVGRLRFRVLLASDEFPYFAETAPVPAEPASQGTICNYPDTFGAFLDDDPIGFTKDNLGNTVLINVAEQVITYNNNTAPEQNHNLDNRCGELDAEEYADVDFNIEYNGLTSSPLKCRYRGQRISSTH